MEVSKYKPLKKGESLQGFFSLILPSGMHLHDLTHHRRTDGAEWVGLPAREYTKSDGEKVWARIVDFTDKQSYQRFQKAAREAIECYFAQHPETVDVPRAGGFAGTTCKTRR